MRLPRRDPNDGIRRRRTTRARALRCSTLMYCIDGGERMGACEVVESLPRPRGSRVRLGRSATTNSTAKRSINLQPFTVATRTPTSVCGSRSEITQPLGVCGSSQRERVPEPRPEFTQTACLSYGATTTETSFGQSADICASWAAQTYANVLRRQRWTQACLCDRGIAPKITRFSSVPRR